jgi:cell pole-organizing protein PopZ
MSDSTRRNGVTLSLARSLAITALVCSPLALAQAQTRATPAPAQTAPTKPAATNPNEEKGGIEQRITQLHAELKITPDQEAKWNSVAQAMRDNAANMEKLAAQHKQQGPTNMSAVDDLDANQQFVQAHLDGLKNFTSAFKSLYDAMSDQQKKNADQIFAKMNRAPQQGGPANRNG